MAEKVEGLLTLIKSEREERAGEVLCVLLLLLLYCIVLYCISRYVCILIVDGCAAKQLQVAIHKKRKNELASRVSKLEALLEQANARIEQMSAENNDSNGNDDAAGEKWRATNICCLVVSENNARRWY
jgi:outer membrane murein-binding lipoprotein Lpp